MLSICEPNLLRQTWRVLLVPGFLLDAEVLYVGFEKVAEGGPPCVEHGIRPLWYSSIVNAARPFYRASRDVNLSLTLHIAAVEYECPIPLLLSLNVLNYVND